MDKPHVKEEEARKRNWVPRFLRWNCWGLPATRLRAAEWSVYAEPLPTPPQSVLSNPIAWATIADNPHLFSLPTPVNYDRLHELAQMHPNQAFVLSVVNGFRMGFWPLADIPHTRPSTIDYSNPMPTDPDHADFLREQHDIKLEKGRYSEGFLELLPGMSAMPLRVVPKDGGSALCLVVNHSKGTHSLKFQQIG